MTETQATYTTADAPVTAPTLEAQLEQARLERDRANDVVIEALAHLAGERSDIFQNVPLNQAEDRIKDMRTMLVDINDAIMGAWKPMLTYVDPVQAITVIVRERDEAQAQILEWKRRAEMGQDQVDWYYQPQLEQARARIARLETAIHNNLDWTGPEGELSFIEMTARARDRVKELEQERDKLAHELRDIKAMFCMDHQPVIPELRGCPECQSAKHYHQRNAEKRRGDTYRSRALALRHTTRKLRGMIRRNASLFTDVRSIAAGMVAELYGEMGKCKELEQEREALQAQLSGSQRALSKALAELRRYNGHGQIEAETLAGGFRETA